MNESSLAEILLSLALRDEQAFRKLAGDPDLDDSLAGFHAQQAVEKALKAVLSHSGVVYRRTHDIAELLDVASDSGISDPPHADRLDELNPYAVEYRYGLIDPGKLDREETKRMVNAVLDWAKSVLESSNTTQAKPPESDE